MPFKVHLLIISCIIIVVLLAWQFMQFSASTAVKKIAEKPSHTLSITHASWGLNCRNIAINSDASRDVFLNKNDPRSKLREDNVLAPVSRLCNGNVKCDINLGESDLGSDPVPDCGSKILEVEYRCFSYDRPWKVKSSGAKLSLKCDQPAQ